MPLPYTAVTISSQVEMAKMALLLLLFPTLLSLFPLLPLNPKPLQIRLVRLTLGVRIISFTTGFFALASRFLLLSRALRDDDDDRGKCAKIILPDDKPTFAFEFDNQSHEVTTSSSASILVFFDDDNSGNTIPSNSGDIRVHKKDKFLRSSLLELLSSSILLEDNGC